MRRGELESRAVLERTLLEHGMRVRDAVLMAGDRAALGLLHQTDLGAVRRLLRTVYRDALGLMDEACAGDGEAESEGAA